MKLKHLLAMAVMTVIGCGSAWADDVLFTEDFSGETYNVSWGGTSAGGIAPEVKDGVLTVANGSKSGDRSAYVSFGDNAYEGSSHLTFDMGITKSGWSGKNNTFYIYPTNETNRYPTRTDALVTISQDANGVITINGDNLGTYSGTKLTYDLYLNSSSGAVTLTVKNGATEINTFNVATTAKGIGAFHLTFNKNFGAFSIDNISLSTYTPVAVSHSFIVNAMCGDQKLKEIKSGIANEGEAYSVALPNTIEKDGQYYVLSGNNSNIASFTMGKADATNEVAYVLDNQIVYFTELEDLNFAGSNYTVDEMSGFSNGKGRSIHRSDVSMDIPFSISEPGIFNIQLPYKNSNEKNREHVISIKNPNGETAELSRRSVGANGGNGVENIEVALAEAGEYTISILCTYNLTATIDYMKVTKIADYNGGEVVGAINMSTPENGAYSSDITLVKGETKTITFQNHGTTFGNNWRIRVKEGETVKSVTRADSWDETAGAATKVAYTQSVDGGATKEAINWETYAAAMADAECVAVLAYGNDNVLSITTTSQNGQYISYVDQDVTMSGADATINLSVCLSWLEVKDVKTTAIARTTATDKFGTICAPFAASVEGATVYSASINAEKTAVVLEEVSAMEAGKPYIYKATADAQTFSYASGDLVSEPVANGPLTGALAATEVPVGSYVMQTQSGVQAFYVVVDGKQPTLSPYKAYLTVPESAGAKMISFGEDSDATAIKALDAITSGKAKIYDLNGRELKSLQKGVNIVNGVKVVVK